MIILQMSNIIFELSPLKLQNQIAILSKKNQIVIKEVIY